MALKRLGTLLVEEGLITEEQLQAALVAQRSSGEQLGEALVKLGHITEESLYRFLAIQHGLEFGELGGKELSPDLVKMVPPAVAWKYKTIPLERENGTFVVATSQPDELSLMYLPKELRLPPDVKLKILVGQSTEVMRLLTKHFPKTGGAGGGRTEGSIRALADRPADSVPSGPVTDQAGMDLLKTAEEVLIDPADTGLEILAEDEEKEEDEVQDEGPIIQMCNFILADAVRRRASDIHLSTYEKKMVLKYRIDGSLIEYPAPPVNARRRIATRYKIMSKTMNIIEKRLPQDGRIHLNLGNKPVDIRISTLPTRWGENIVMRVVDQSKGLMDLDQLGFEPEQLAQFQKAASQPYGMVFVTGPTASGKTTTLFGALKYVNTPNLNIMTVEDPVEFRLPWVIQIQVDPNAGRSFASVLRAFLRHDPNKILVGEIRDAETASIAVKASLTGHLVLSSLHTNDAASSIMRLVDMGIEHVYVGSSVLCIASQRLIRKICDTCKEPIVVPEEELKRVGLKPEDVKDTKFFRGKGCSECNQTGYRGRLAVYEVMPITASIREVIFSKGTLAQIKHAAREAGFKSIRDNALMKWRRGLTTLEEVLGETYE